MESEQLYHRGYCRNSYNSIASASSDEELLDGAGVIMDFHTTEDDNLLDGDAASPGRMFATSKMFAALAQKHFSRGELADFRWCLVFCFHLIFSPRCPSPSWPAADQIEKRPEEMWEGIRRSQRLLKYDQRVLIKVVRSFLVLSWRQEKSPVHDEMYFFFYHYTTFLN